MSAWRPAWKRDPDHTSGHPPSDHLSHYTDALRQDRPAYVPLHYQQGRDRPMPVWLWTPDYVADHSRMLELDR